MAPFRVECSGGPGRRPGPPPGSSRGPRELQVTVQPLLKLKPPPQGLPVSRNQYW